MPDENRPVPGMARDQYVVIDIATARALQGRAGTVFIDCRYSLQAPESGYEDYLQAHIPGAVYACLHSDLSVARDGAGRHPLPSPAAMNRLFQRLGVSACSVVVAYDDAGGAMAAARLWWMLRYMGHERVSVLDGGWSAWRAAGAPIEQGLHPPVHGSFSGHPLRRLRVSAANIGRAQLVVDSRTAARYRGEQENIDPVAGHIPGARHHCFSSNLCPDSGMFLPVPELRRGFLDLFAGHQPAAAVFYCGSGVTACHNILAVCHAGLPMPKLYPGSWSQWCQLGLPVATGDNVL